MIAPIALGVSAFALMLTSDLLELKRRPLPVLFFLGGALLALCTAWLFVRADPLRMFRASPIPFLVFGAMSAGCVYLELRVLFFSLPFENTYRKNGKKQCVNAGWYALCRHPGALVLSVLYVSLMLMVPSFEMLLALLLFPGLNIGYVFVQDRLIFVHTIEGYEKYRNAVPFLIPNRLSIRRALPKKRM